MNSISIYSCPVCHLPLVLSDRQYRCENNHCYDMAKEGYVNLLLANQKKSKDAGDSKAMINARRQFLSQGYYDPLPEALTELLQSHLADDTPQNILDLGCGDGYYTGYIQARSPDNFHFWGLDISKPGIIASAKGFKSINFSVSSSFRPPFMDESLDGVIKIYAPGDEQEFRRILKKGGIYISVVQGKRHLFGLKKIIYPDPQEHTGDEALPEGFELLTEKTVKDEITVTGSEAINNLLLMTPYYWHIPEEVQAKVASMDKLVTEIEFAIRVYRKQ